MTLPLLSMPPTHVISSGAQDPPDLSSITFFVIINYQTPFLPLPLLSLFTSKGKPWAWLDLTLYLWKTHIHKMTGPTLNPWPEISNWHSALPGNTTTLSKFMCLFFQTVVSHLLLSTQNFYILPPKYSHTESCTTAKVSILIACLNAIRCN